MSPISKKQIIKGVRNIMKGYWYAFNEGDELLMKVYKEAAIEYKDQYDIDNVLSQDEFQELLDYKEELKHGRK